MSTIETPNGVATVADLIDRLGGIAPQRIRFNPVPGTATEEDVVLLEARENRLCELVDGTLVEKVMGYAEALLALALGSILREFVVSQNLGIVTGADGMVRLFPGLVRIPDVAFASWDRLPGRAVPKNPIPDLAPDLAVEILSKSNTHSEIQRKLNEYFDAGVRLVWLVDPDRRTCRVFSSLEKSIALGEDDDLTGGDVLPGFKLRLVDLFVELDRRD